MLVVAERTWLVETFWSEGPHELGGGWDVKNALKGTWFEYKGTCEGI